MQTDERNTTRLDPADVNCVGIFVSISPAMKAEVSELARLEGRTMSGLIRVLLSQRLARRRKPESRS